MMLCRSFFDRQVVQPCRRHAKDQAVDCTVSRNVCKEIRGIHRNAQCSSPVNTRKSDIYPMKVGPWTGRNLGNLVRRIGIRHSRVRMATREPRLIDLSEQSHHRIFTVLLIQGPLPQYLSLFRLARHLLADFQVRTSDLSFPPTLGIHEFEASFYRQGYCFENGIRCHNEQHSMMPRNFRERRTKNLRTG